LALLLDELPQRPSADEAAVEPVEGVEKRLAALTPCARARLVYQWLGRAEDNLADQALARSEPAIDRRPAEAELGSDRLNVDPAPAQVTLHARGEHVLAAGSRRPASAGGGLGFWRHRG